MRPATNLLMLVLTASAIFARGAMVCVPREHDALLAFKRGITDDPAGRLASWQRDNDCCRWRGVRCSNRTGHVLELRLGNDEQMYDHQLYLTGKISPSLFSLKHLEHLDLGENLLDFPSDGYSSKLLGSVQSLRYLNLSGITFDGTLPPELGNLSKLQYLDLSSTTSSVQPTDLSWLTRLSLLHHLDLSGVNLSMVHHWPHIVNMIPSLQVLYLSWCSLQNANQRLTHLNLTKLESLALNDNNFDHPSKSCWFWNLTSLKHLNLQHSLLYGQFPNTLRKMTSLQAFDFSFNGGTGLTCSIIVANLMRNLCNLEVLNLEACVLCGTVTELYESLPRCSPNRLRELNLAGNNITGTLPAGIAKLTSLVTLDLSYNHMIGPVPSEIGMLNNLTYIDLGYNNLTGVITEEHFAGLMSLRHIDLSGNLLKIVVLPDRLPPLRLDTAYFASCQMGPRFPSWLQRLAGVDYAIDMSNTGIVDQFPYWFSTTLSRALFLDLSDNQINGSLPKNLEIMSLNYLILDRNQITGEIPPLPRNLVYFSILNNALSGHIPGSMCKCHELQYLNLGNSNLEGEFPRCLEMRNITNLVLSNNMFSGKFPSFLQSCKDIRFLDLSGNKLSGTLPTWIGDFVKIEYLRLSYNMFSGSLPFSITSLREMYDFNLAGNRFSGSIPWNLSNLKSMAEKHASVGGLAQPFYNFSVVTKRQELYYGDRLNGMVTIDLSLNCLTGVIPEKITSLGGLVNLNLSWNYLTGEIPHNIGSMPSLESLDLSRNKLSGEISPSLSNLTYLAYLDLPYNNLSGRIPSGSQLDTLYNNYPYMYNGNDDLCGPPLQQNCLAGNNATNLGNGDHKRSAHVSGPMFFHLGLGSGFVVGLWVVFCTMLFKKTWRVAYFRLFDKVYDKLYVFVVITWARLGQQTLQLIGRLA